MYNTIGRYSDTRQFGASTIVEGSDNAPLCILNPACSPSFTQRSTIHGLKHKLFQPVDNTVQKDVWGPGTCCLRQDMLGRELKDGWTVFQRRTFTKTPVLWMQEADAQPEPQYLC